MGHKAYRICFARVLRGACTRTRRTTIFTASVRLWKLMKNAGTWKKRCVRPKARSIYLTGRIS